MAIPAPNYTQTPNVFFDEIMKTLNEGELRILLLIIRQTVGWHKLEDWITLKLLAENTGYERRSVCRILQRLIEKNLVFKRTEGPKGYQKCYYGLVTESRPKEVVDESDGIETEEEMAIFQKCYTSDRPVRGGVTDRSGGGVTDGSPTKETHTKETIQKKQQQGAIPETAQANGPKTVVVSSKSSIPEKTKPPIYEILKKVDIPEFDKAEITRTYPEEAVIHAIDWISKYTKPIENLAAMIKWACKNKPVIAEDPKSLEDKNKEYAMKHDGMKNQYVKVDALSSSVEIVYPGAMKDPTSIPYSIRGFIEQFQNALRKVNLIPLRI